MLVLHGRVPVVRIVLGGGLPEQGLIEVDALTLGQALVKVGKERPWVRDEGVRVFVDGVDADRLEGPDTPVGGEDTLVLTTF